MKRVAVRLLEDPFTRCAMGIVLAVLLAPICFYSLVVATGLVNERRLSFDAAGFIVVMMLGACLALIPTVLLGIPLIMIRRHLGALALPAVVIAAAIGGGLTMKYVLLPGRHDWQPFTEGALYSLPSAVAFWWLALRHRPCAQLQPPDSAVTAVAEQRPRHPAGG